jgi:hypothetical protein
MVATPMSIRLASLAVIPAVLVGGALAFHGSAERAPDPVIASQPTSLPQPIEGEALPSENGATLPPHHPPIGASLSPHGSLPAAANEVPTLRWTMPAGWQEAPSPNAMRLATYRAPGGVEVSVSRAGGATEANIQRWIAQFDNVGREGRVEKTVNGLHVVTVDVAGTYVGGGMNGAMTAKAPTETHPDWAMAGAIVETPGLSYFFKMTGPAAAVRASRPAFDRLVYGSAPM